MQRLLLVLTVTLLGLRAVAQSTGSDTSKSFKNIDWSYKILGGKAQDHFVFQLGYCDFFNKYDSIGLHGWNRTFDGYFMMNFPQPGNEKYAIAVGIGVGSDNYYLNKMKVDLTDPQRLTFISDTATAYHKSKLSTTYLEVPVELRYNTNPNNLNHSYKIAAGLKLGALVDAHTKEKIARDLSGLTNYTIKQRDNHLFNPVRAVGEIRVGYGVWSLFFQADLTSYVKAGDGPPIRPWSVGVAIAGL